MICVNQRDRIDWEPGMTVADLLALMRYTFPHIVVKVNADTIAPEDYPTHPIPDQADVRVIHLIAGG